MMRRNLCVNFSLLILLIALTTAGCGKGGFSDRVKAGKETVFRYPIVTSPTSLDPGIVQDGDTIDLLQQVYEGLVTWGTDNRVHPLLAESWELEDGGRTYVFTLKKGVKFHSGREVTAHDFKWSIERATDPAFKSPTANTYLGEIVGVKDKVRGAAKEVSGYQVVDDYTLRITIDKPRPYFLGKLTYIIGAVVDKDKVPALGVDDAGNPSWPEIKSTDQMCGTGPYKAERYEPDQIMILAANQDYHATPPKISHIERPIIKDAVTRLNKYKAGELDLVMLERQDVLELQKDPTFKEHLHFFERPSLWYIGLNLKNPPDGYAQFMNRKVRQAIGMAIDREKICNQVLDGINPLANSIIPPGVLGFRESARFLPYDVSAAKRLLAEAGYPGGKGFPKLTMFFREARPDISLVAEEVAGQLKTNLGITVSLQTMEWRSYLEKHNADAVPFFHMRWAADYLDPENFLSFLLAGYGPENHVTYHNPEFDALCAAADSEMDEAKRLEMYAKAEDIVLQDAPFIPIYFQRDAELIRPRVKGLRESLFGHLPHTTVYLEGDL